MRTLGRVVRAASLVLTFVCLSGSAARADTLLLIWSPNEEPNIKGYLLSWGTASHQYTAAIDVGDQTTYAFSEPDPTRSYYFAVRAYNVDGLVSVYSEEVSSPPYQPFTDNTLIAGVTIIRAVHVAELRARIDALRSRALLGAYSYSNGTITAGASVVQPKDLTEMRQALRDVYVAAGRTPPSYTTNVTVGGAILVTDFSELRAAVMGIE